MQFLQKAFDWSPDAGDYPWRIFPIATVPTLRSGNNGSETYGPTYNSVLRATARAAGTLTFRFGDVRNGYNTSVFTAPDGTRTTVRTSTTAATAWKSLSVAVKPGDVLTWSREVDYANKEYEAYEYGGAVGTIRCGAFLRDFVWTPADDPPPSVGWFDVKWSSQGWGSGFDWRTAAGEAAAGGTWSVPSGDASSLSGGLLALGVPDGGVLRFTAVSPSAGGGTVTVDGKLAPVVSTDLPDVPSGAFAALCFARGGYKAWNGTQWVALSGAAPAASATQWSATFDFSSSPNRVRYAVGGKTLSASGSEWIPLASAPGYVRGVGYTGGGAVGDFKATCAGGFPVPALATPDDGPLSFGTDGSNNPTFQVTIRNAVKDAWYTVYAADAVNGTYTAVTSVKATADGLKTLSIPAPSSKPTRFVRIGVSDAEVPANTEL